MVWHQISRTSALDLTFGKIGTLIREQVLCWRRRGVFLMMKSLEVLSLKVLCSRDLGNVYDKYWLYLK
jgi:hypothetical protein